MRISIKAKMKMKMKSSKNRANIKWLALLIFFLTAVGCHKGASYYSFDGITQGTTFHIIFEINEQMVRDRYNYKALCDSVDLYLKDIDFALSGYNKASILSLFNDNTDSLHRALLFDTSSELMRRYNIFLENFHLAQKAYEITGGKVDCSAAPLFDLWGFGFKEGGEVTQVQIDSVKQFIGMENFFIAESKAEPKAKYSDNSVQNSTILIGKKDERCRLNFNAVAQGYTADYIGSKFSQIGIENYLIEVGGEILVKGLNAKGKKWSIGIDTPEDGNNQSGEKIQEIIEISEGAVVTSGDYRKYYIKEGRKVAHTIDPISGYPVEHNLLSATILAPTSAWADIYATYVMTLGLEKGQSAIESIDSITGAILIYDGRSELKVDSDIDTSTNTDTETDTNSVGRFSVWKYRN